MIAARVAAALVSCSFLAGCAAIGPADQVLAKAPGVPRPAADAPAAPDLRIPADAVASFQEIPLVPVPPVPIGRGAAPQAATLPPPAPPPPALPAPSRPPMAPPDPFPTAPAIVTPASADATPLAPAPPAEQDTATASLRQLHQQAAAWYAGVDSYTVRMTRREVINGTAKPEEIMLFKFRKEPWSVYFKWLGDTGKGREVIYVKGRYDSKIHTRLAAGDALLMPAGAKMALAPDSLLVRAASRHSITDAGIGACIDRFGGLLDAQERGDKSHGVLTDLGEQKRPEFSQPAHTAELTIPAGAEPALPNGGRRVFYFDAETHLPLLVVTHDDKNQEVEYYHYDRLLAPGHLDDGDFDPEKVWSNTKPDGPGGKGS